MNINLILTIYVLQKNTSDSNQHHDSLETNITNLLQLEKKIPKGHIASFNSKMNSSEENATQIAFANGQDIFKNLLNFLKFVVDKRCFTKQHYHLVRREFVM